MGRTAGPTERSVGEVAVTRVLVVLPPETWGGLHAFTATIAPLLRERGWEQVVVVPEAAVGIQKRLRAAGVTVVPAPIRRLRRSPWESGKTLLRIPAEIAGLRRLCRQHNIVVVQAVGAHHYHGLLVAKTSGLPLVWQLHSDLISEAIRPLVAIVIRSSASAVMTNGRSIARSFFGSRADSDQITVFYAPVDSERFRPSSASRAQARARLGIEEDVVMCGTLGNRVDQKNHQLLVQVARMTAHLYPKLRYLILGGRDVGYEQVYAREVLAPAQGINVEYEKFMTITDPGDDVRLFLSALDIFILTSRAEGVPISLFEASCMELPTIAVNVGAIGEVVEEGLTGLLVEPGARAAEALAAGVARLTNDSGARLRMGAAARERILSEFTIESVVEAHVAAYEAATASTRHRL